MEFCNNNWIANKSVENRATKERWNYFHFENGRKLNWCHKNRWNVLHLFSDISILDLFVYFNENILYFTLFCMHTRHWYRLPRLLDKIYWLSPTHIHKIFYTQQTCRAIVTDIFISRWIHAFMYTSDLDWTTKYVYCVHVRTYTNVLLLLFFFCRMKFCWNCGDTFVCRKSKIKTFVDIKWLTFSFCLPHC